jgi:pectinesterase
MQEKKLYTIYYLIIFALLSLTLYSQSIKIIVSKTGKDNYRSIQGAINSLSDTGSAPRFIFIRNGIYKEKLYIEKNNIVLQGEDREKTIITQSIARDAWRCLHNEDWGVATMNVDGNDITLKNMTITNSYGFDWKKDETIYCASDTISKQKTIAKNGHQMALRTMNTTRLKAINCRFKAFGGDTVSPWNVDNGMFYFKDCVLEGGVDFYCPRGWAFAENCEFISHSGPAAIWHDGSKHEDSKTVLKNCSFKGFGGFKLGRYHRDAQFYLINCSFAENMADEAIYRVPVPGNIILWGHRVYFYNCHRKGGDYAWHANNLSSAPASPDPASINAHWVFGSRWNPLMN